MKKELQKQLARMSFVVLVMIAFAVWQHEFVATAINSNIILNSTIIGTFIFGLGLSFKYLVDLFNEMTAFDALRESYNDIQRREEDETDPFWRFQRCQVPAKIFSSPQIMGQSYSLISDEMSRTGDLKISAGTMQTLVDGIDTKLEDQKSLVTYITGLLVFLGLIGTFVGLMVTLASVGKIIGELDLSGGGGTEVIQRLMTNLQTPLQGMATGFSSSLFGLITSLALGLISRFESFAASNLKLEFEAWLSGVVRISDDKTGDNPTAHFERTGPDMQHLRLMYNVAKYSITATNRSNRTLDRLTAVVAGLTQEQTKQGDATSSLSAHMEKNAQYQSLMSFHLGRTAKALEAHDHVAIKLREIDVALNGRLDNLATSMDRSTGNIEALTEELINLSVPDENELDVDFERMMGEIDNHILREREIIAEPMAQAMSQTVNSDITRPTVTPRSHQTRTPPTKRDRTDAVSELREKLNKPYDGKQDREV